MPTSFLTYHAFIKNEYADRCDTPAVRAAYKKAGGFKAFKRNYVKYEGFTAYLTALKGCSLTALQTYHLVKPYLIYGERQPADVPALLASIARLYQIEYPAVHGLLTEDYWAQRFASR